MGDGFIWVGELMSDVKDHSFQKYVIRVERESVVRKRMRERERENEKGSQPCHNN